MNNAFLQFELDSVSREITAFATHEGFHRFKRSKFRGNVASEILQRKMEKILGNLPNCIAIADNLILIESSLDTVYNTVHKVLNLFLLCGITLKKQKCELFINKVEFFGFVFSKNGIVPPQTKIKNIQNMPQPTYILELHSFLGMANCLSRFIPNFSVHIYPLLELKKKNIPYLWTHKHQTTFEKLKTELASPKVMSNHVPSLISLIITDAKTVGISAILIQQSSDNS